LINNALTRHPYATVQHQDHPTARRRALHLIALYEALKGFAALIAALGLLSMLHKDLHQLALSLLLRFHLDSALPLPTAFVHYADKLAALKTSTLVPLAVGYVAIRLSEAWGLWKEKVWAEWLGALSGAIYIPFEIDHLVHRTTLINAGVLLANVLMVAFLAFQLWRRKPKPIRLRS
jgi:uncharacterized membrane protein (DUF2068 family)